MSLERLLPLARRLDLVSSSGCSPCPSTIVFKVAKNGVGSSHLRRLDEIERVALVPVGVEVFVYALANRTAVGMLLQRVHQTRGRGC